MVTPPRQPPWDDLRVLLAVHRERSFLAAGRALGVSTSTVARRIDALEAALGRPLVSRSTGGAVAFPDAAELVALAEQLELGLEAVRRDGESESAAAGIVRISMGEGFVQPVTRFLADIRRAHPRIAFEILSEARFVDLARREADYGIRKARSESPALIQRSVGRLHFGVYASHDYLERRVRGGRLRAADLPRHDFLAHDRSMLVPQTEWLGQHGITRFALRSTSDLAIVEGTLRGMGLSLIADGQARELPGLVRVDIDVPLPTLPVFLVYHRDLRQVPRYRIVGRALEAALRAGLA